MVPAKPPPLLSSVSYSSCRATRSCSLLRTPSEPPRLSSSIPGPSVSTFRSSKAPIKPIPLRFASTPTKPPPRAESTFCSATPLAVCTRVIIWWGNSARFAAYSASTTPIALTSAFWSSTQQPEATPWSRPASFTPPAISPASSSPS